MQRRAQPVSVIEYDVELAQPATHVTAAHVAQELAKHLLFMRGQAPALIDELAAGLQTQV
jgi:hypothetical protein